jgi:hypothetical protein
MRGVEMLTLGGLCCVGFIDPFGVVAGVWRQRLAIYIGSTWRRRQNPVSETSVLNKRQDYG